MYGGNARSDRNYIIRNGALAVPSDFVGLHFRAWPIFNAALWASASQPYPSAPSPAPTIGFGSYRTHDSGYTTWHLVEKTQGVYDWSDVDTLITTHRTAGRSVVFCTSGVPSFYLSPGNPARGTSGENNAYPDSTSPNGLTAAGNYITALITRYNDPAGAWRVANPGLGKGIQTFELWNEPVFGTTSGFWVGTLGQFIDLCYTMRTAAKAADPSLPVVSPGFIAPNTMQQFLQGSGTINTGVTGLSLCEAICIHYYRVMPPCAGFDNFDYELLSSDRYLKTVIATCGASALPIWSSEAGMDYNAPTNALTIIAAQSPQWRYSWWGRIMLVAAALGYQKWMSYAWDTPYSSYPDYDPNGTAKVINDVHANVAGKTIKNAFYDVGGAVTLQFSDGSSFSV